MILPISTCPCSWYLLDITNFVSMLILFAEIFGPGQKHVTRDATWCWTRLMERGLGGTIMKPWAWKLWNTFTGMDRNGISRNEKIEQNP